MSDQPQRAAERLGLLTKLGFARRTVNRSSTLYCPHCRAGSHERMSLDHTLHEFHCLWCNRTMRHEPEQHCIFCAFGSRPCPEKQQRR